MIKIKLSDPNNMKSFSGFIHTRDLLREYSIEITDSNDYDYEFIHANEFVNTNLPLQESIDMGLENLSKKTGDYFLFHGGDSTSIVGAYEVFVESNAKFLFKKQLLSQEDYKEKTATNRWFFGKGSELRPGSYIDICSKIFIGEKVIIRPGSFFSLGGAFCSPKNNDNQ